MITEITFEKCVHIKNKYIINVRDNAYGLTRLNAVYAWCWYFNMADEDMKTILKRYNVFFGDSITSHNDEHYTYFNKNDLKKIVEWIESTEVEKKLRGVG